MTKPQPGQTINVRLKQEYGGALIVGVVDGVNSQEWILNDACHADTFESIGRLPVHLDAVESFEVV